jgi:hypothetical protein
LNWDTAAWYMGQQAEKKADYLGVPIPASDF